MSHQTMIHFSGDDYWNSNPHSRYHLTNAFWQKGYKVVWINPIGTRFPSRKIKSLFYYRIYNKIKSLLKLLKKIDTDFYVYTPFLIPSFTRNIFQHVNSILLKLQLYLLKLIIGINSPYLFFTSPVYGYAINFLPYKKSIYYFSDQYTSYRELSSKNREYLISLDKLLYTKSDLILCASQMIYDDIKTKTKKPVFYTPHQVDYKFFKKALLDKNKPSDIDDIGYPIFGYYGTLSDSNDWDLIEYCALQRPHYNFVFIGQKNINIPQIEKLNNVFFLGKKPYKEIPHYSKFFDVCIMFWIRRNWIKHCSPLKLKEYISVEKPIVSTFIEEAIMHFKDIIYVSKNDEEFLNNLDLALCNNRERINRGLDKIKNESWTNLADRISFLLNNEVEI